MRHMPNGKVAASGRGARLVPALLPAESLTDETSRRGVEVSLRLPLIGDSGARAVQFYVSEPLQPPAKMGQHSIGVDNHTWVLRDAFVEAIIPGFDRSVVSNAVEQHQTSDAH